MTDTAVCGPEQLADAIVGFVVRKSGIESARVRAVVDRVITDAGAGAVDRLRARLAQPPDAWSYYSRDPLAREVHIQLANVVLAHPPVVHGARHLDAVHGRPLIIVANHLSYSDANVIDVLLHRCGQSEVADRLAVIAGPKVYSDLGRRFSSLCFGTIKSPQNEQVSSGEAAMSAKDVARAARQTMAAAQSRLAAGDALLIFPEGTRSRSGEMQPFLAGVARYFEDDDVAVVPVGLTGTERMFAIGEERLGDAAITMHIGAPMTVRSIRAVASTRREFVDRLGHSVAAVLPPQYRGAYR